MEFKIDRRSALKAGAALAAVADRSRLGAGQADDALRRGVLGQGHPRRHDQDVRQGHRGRLHGRAVTTAARCSSRAPSWSRCSATTSRSATSRRRTSRKQMPAWSILTSAYTVPRRQPRARVLRERPRRADEEGGRGPAQDQDPRADVLRHPAGRPEAEEEDQHAGGHGRHQAADAAGRRVAAARPLDRREPDADGVCRDVHRAADRRGRRPGQPAAQRAEHEVLRGDVADRADLAPGRLRRAVHEPEDLERHERRPSRRPSRPRSTRRSRGARPGAPEERGGARRQLQEAGPRRSTRRTSTRSAPTRRRSTSPPTRRRPGRRGCSTRSPRSSSGACRGPMRGPRHRRSPGRSRPTRRRARGATRFRGRQGGRIVHSDHAAAPSTGCGAARRTSLPACSASCSSRSSSRSSSATSSTSPSAGRPSCPSSPGCTWC